MDIALVGLNTLQEQDNLLITKIAEDKVVMALPIGMGKSQNMNGRTFPLNMIAEIAPMINLVREAQDTNYWSSGNVMSDRKKQKAKDRKKWAKIRRKQGR